jgi:hypothetical protein
MSSQAHPREEKDRDRDGDRDRGRERDRDRDHGRTKERDRDNGKFRDTDRNGGDAKLEEQSSQSRKRDRDRRKSRSRSPARPEESQSDSDGSRDSRGKKSHRKKHSRHAASREGAEKQVRHKDRSRDDEHDREHDAERKSGKKHKESDRDRDREREKDRGRDKDRNREKDRERGKDRDGEKVHEKDRDHGKERDRGNKEKAKETSERDGNRDRDRENGKDKGNKAAGGVATVDSHEDEEARKAAEAEALDEEIRKRRERVRQWQLKRAGSAIADSLLVHSQADDTAVDIHKEAVTDAADVVTNDANEGAVNVDEETTEQQLHQHHHPSWSLDDESEDDETSDPDTDARKNMDISDDVAMPHAYNEPSDLAFSVPTDTSEQSNGFKAVAEHANAPRGFSNVGSSSSAKVSVLGPPADDESEIDPLDEFMNSLHGVYMPEYGQSQTEHSLHNDSQSTTSAPSSSANRNRRSRGLSAFGSNTITLEDIMQTRKNEKKEEKMAVEDGHSNDSPLEAGKGLEFGLGSGWESDASHGQSANRQRPHTKRTSSSADDSDLEDEELDEEEEAARRAFIAALKEAPVNTRDVVAQTTKVAKPLPHMSTTSADTTAVIPNEGEGDTRAQPPTEVQLGRLFASDGDMIEETEVYAKKRSALEIIEEAKKAKELKAVDHSQITYMPFRKNLFIVPKALGRLSEGDVAAKREDLQIKVHQPFNIGGTLLY